MQPSGHSPWAVLGIPEGATRGEARRAFRRLVKRTHPDTGGDGQAFAAVVAAFQELQPQLRPDPLCRRRTPYDAVLRGAPPPSRSWGEPVAIRRPTRPPRQDFAAILAAEMARLAA